MAIKGGDWLSAGSSLLGGWMNQDSAKDIARAQYKYQKKFAQQAIQWRVRDAKKAGLHPLYALGAQVPSYTPVSQDTSSMGDALATAGQNIGSALSARQTPVQKKLTDLALAQAQADLDKTYAESALLRSERALAIQRSFNWLPEENTKETGTVGTVFGGQAVKDLPGAVPSNMITPQAPNVYSEKSTGVASGTTPMMREFRLPSGLPIMLPGGMQGDPSEALESLAESPLMLYAVWKENTRVYGKSWGDRFLRDYMPLGGTAVKGLEWWRSLGTRPAPGQTRARTRQDYR